LAFLNLARTKASRANQKALGCSVDYRADGLEVGHLAAFGYARDIQTDTAYLFRFAPAGDLPGLDGALIADVTNFRHNKLLLVKEESRVFLRPFRVFRG
jgi:hypothetical protein